MIKEAIARLVDGGSLTSQEAAEVMVEIMEGNTTQAQLGSFVTALRMKGETAEELAGLAATMREKAIQVKVDLPLLDIVGTGGDGLNTFNISTAAAVVAAAAGLNVAKHGNRAITGCCGSADVLEKLGVKIDLNSLQVQKCIQEVGLGFMFAPIFHPAMKHAAGPRREIGIRTVFNILGPLTNPAHAQHQLIGVPSLKLIEKMMPALVQLGTQHALVVHGLDGMDEISISGQSIYWEVKTGALCASKRLISPEEFGFERAPRNAIQGGTAAENAQTMIEIFNGLHGPKRNVVILNAAAGLVAGDRVEDLHRGVLLAQEIIDRGKAMAKLRQLIEFTSILSEDRDVAGANCTK